MHQQKVHKVRAETNGSCNGLNQEERRVTGSNDEGGDILSIPTHLKQPRTPLAKVKWPWFQWRKFWREELSPLQRGIVIVTVALAVTMAVISAYYHFHDG